MNRLLDASAENWFSILLMAIALLLGAALLYVWHRRREWPLPLILFGSAFALLGVGGLAVPAPWGWWLAGGSAAILFVMLLGVIITGAWSAALGYSVGGLLLLGLGAAGNSAIAHGLAEAGKLIASLEP